MIKAQLPDGSTIEVPSHPIYTQRNPIGTKRYPKEYAGEEPDPHPDYTFSPAIGGVWLATPRY